MERVIQFRIRFSGGHFKHGNLQGENKRKEFDN